MKHHHPTSTLIVIFLRVLFYILLYYYISSTTALAAILALLTLMKHTQLTSLSVIFFSSRIASCLQLTETFVASMNGISRL